MTHVRTEELVGELPTNWGQEPWRVRLCQARKDRFPSREAAAEASGLSSATWKGVETGWRYEKGEPKPYITKPVTLTKIARALDLDPFALVEEAGFKRSQVPVSVMEVTPTERGSVTVLVLGRLTDLTAAELAAIPDQVKEVLARATAGYEQ